MKLKNLLISVGVLVIIGVLLFVIKTNGQSIVYEKTFGSLYAEFRPNAIAVDKEGNSYITGRCETNLAYFKKVGDDYKYADTTIPEGTHLYLYKINNEGKLTKRIFLWAIEGIDLCITKDGNIALTGFVTRYRKENYEGDRTQGVYSAMLNKNLEMIWQKIDSSQYNSVPEKMIETKDGNLLIVAHSMIKKVPLNYGLTDDDTHDRFLLINKNGKTIKDTTLEMVEIDHSKTDEFLHLKPLYNANAPKIAPANLIYDVIETETSFVFAGTAMSNEMGIAMGQKFFIMETDKQFKLIKTKSYEFKRDTQQENDENWGYSIAKDGDNYIMAGIAHYSGNRNMIAYLDKNFDTLYTKHFNGDIFSFPKVISLSNGKYCTCSYTDSDQIAFNLFKDKKLISKMSSGKYKIIDFHASMAVKDRYAYITAVCKDSGVASTYLAKVKF